MITLDVLAWMNSDVEGASCTALAAWDDILFLSHILLLLHNRFGDAILISEFLGAIDRATGKSGEPRNPVAIDVIFYSEGGQLYCRTIRKIDRSEPQ